MGNGMFKVTSPTHSYSSSPASSPAIYGGTNDECVTFLEGIFSQDTTMPWEDICIEMLKQDIKQFETMPVKTKRICDYALSVDMLLSRYVPSEYYSTQKFS